MVTPLWVICPKCHQRSGMSLTTPTRDSLVAQFECDDCGHVWTQPPPKVEKHFGS